MKLRAVLEKLSTETWQRLRDARGLGIRFGEETVTDLLLLELKRLKPAGIHIIQTPKSQEAVHGTDWEWWVGSQGAGWVRLAIQAKRLDRSGSRYSELGHKVGSQLQIDLLERFAHRNQALPMYCLYNYLDGPDLTTCWQCGVAPQVDQLGCTLTPAATVRTALATWGGRTFEALHSNSTTLPWRCWVSCPKVLANAAAVERESRVDTCKRDSQTVSFARHRSLPPEVTLGIDTGWLSEFSRAHYRTEGEESISLPRWVVVIDQADGLS